MLSNAMIWPGAFLRDPLGGDSVLHAYSTLLEGILFCGSNGNEHSHHRRVVVAALLCVRELSLSAYPSTASCSRKRFLATEQII